MINVIYSNIYSTRLRIGKNYCGGGGLLRYLAHSGRFLDKEMEQTSTYASKGQYIVGIPLNAKGFFENNEENSSHFSWSSEVYFFLEL
jgi:hypothetical protein